MQTNLFLVAAELFLFETDALVRELLGEDLRVPNIRVHAPGELLGTVCLVQHILGEHLQVREVRAEDGAAQALEIRVVGVVHLCDTPRVDTRADGLAVDVDLLLGANDGEREESLVSE